MLIKLFQKVLMNINWSHIHFDKQKYKSLHHNLILNSYRFVTFILICQVATLL